jgi:hypothetical protein
VPQREEPAKSKSIDSHRRRTHSTPMHALLACIPAPQDSWCRVHGPYLDRMWLLGWRRPLPLNQGWVLKLGATLTRASFFPAIVVRGSLNTRQITLQRANQSKHGWGRDLCTQICMEGACPQSVIQWEMCVVSLQAYQKASIGGGCTYCAGAHAKVGACAPDFTRVSATRVSAECSTTARERRILRQGLP